MKKLCLLLMLIIILSAPAVSLAQEQDANITRAEFIKEIVTQAEMHVVEVTESSFNDVTDPEFISYIETAYKKGITSGYGTYFDPEGNVTKEQAVIMLVNAFGERAGLKETAGEAADQALTFSDSQDINSWAKPYIAYALSTGLVAEAGDTFNPQTPITAEEAKSLISTAKSVHQQLFTRDGMAASDMLVLVNENSANANTYKQKGTMLTQMEILIEGVTPEQLEETPEITALLGEGMNITMQIDMDMSVQPPDKVYMKQMVKSDIGIEEAVQETEILMDGSLMYTKMAGTDKWVMQDLGSIMNQIQSISDREPYQMSQLSEDELKMFKEFARYEDDVEIDKKEYYVISFSIDKDTYQEYYMEIMEKVMDSVVTLQMESPQLQQDPTFDPEQYKQMMIHLITNMEVELSYKYYINKETKFYEKMWLSQDMTMPMQQFMTEAMTMLGEDAPDFSVKVLTHSEGEFELYDLDVDVDFPEIDDEDIMDINQPIPVE